MVFGALLGVNSTHVAIVKTFHLSVDLAPNALQNGSTNGGVVSKPLASKLLNFASLSRHIH